MKEKDEKLTYHFCFEREAERNKKSIYHFYVEVQKYEVGSKPEHFYFVLFFFLFFLDTPCPPEILLIGNIKRQRKAKKCKPKADDRVTSKQEDVQNSIHF